MPAESIKDPRTLYQRVILKHARAPVGLDRRLRATHRARGDNPLCGDEVDIALRVAEGVIAEAAYAGEFCAVCSASASLLCEHVAGLTVAEFDTLTAELLAALEGRPAGERLAEERLAEERLAEERLAEERLAEERLADDLRALLAVRQFPVRVKCAALPWHAARKALEGGAG